MGFSGGQSNGIISGYLANGQSENVPVTSDGHLEVAIHEPVGAFGEIIIAGLTPLVQIDAAYGIVDTDHETFTDGVTGAVTSATSMYTVTTGTGVGGYGVVRSRRLARYRPGQGIRARFTAMFPTAGVANSLLVAGLFNSEDGLFIGYSGTSFGFMRRIAGAAHITRLTVSAGAGGAETITVTLNSAAFTIASGGALSTTATAEAIAERVGGYTGWTSSVSPTSNGTTVTFIQSTPGTAAGTFTLSSTGTAAGTFSTIQAGSANDSVTGFVAQTAWNVDRLDGTAGDNNPSGETLDPSKLGVWEMIVPFLGAGTIELRWMGQSGEFNTVHRIRYPNSAVIPSFKNPTFRIGWVAASLGSTSNLSVSGASGAIFTEGQLVSTRDSKAILNGNYSAVATEYVALVIRNRGEYSSKLNFREVVPALIDIGCETASRLLAARVVLNPVMTGIINWQYVDQTRSCVEYATPTTVAATNGSLLAATVAAATSEIDLQKLDLRLEPGDTLAVCIAAVSNTATAAVTINWQER